MCVYTTGMPENSTHYSMWYAGLDAAHMSGSVGGVWWTVPTTKMELLDPSYI